MVIGCGEVSGGCCGLATSGIDCALACVWGKVELADCGKAGVTGGEVWAKVGFTSCGVWEIAGFAP